MYPATHFAREMYRSGKYFESEGKNRSPAIDALCREFHYPLASHWCILYISKAFKLSEEAGNWALPKILKTAGSQTLLAWFKDHGWTSNDPQDLKDWKGAIIIRTNPDGEHGHGAIAEKRFTNLSTGKIVALGTLEGNTDKYGGANGDGAYERKRIIPLKPYKWTYCNTSFIAGGQWWLNDQ
jgi:hypothetical protein